jgi:hypothetical protein
MACQYLSLHERHDQRCQQKTGSLASETITKSDDSIRFSCHTFVSIVQQSLMAPWGMTQISFSANNVTCFVMPAVWMKLMNDVISSVGAIKALNFVEIVPTPIRGDFVQANQLYGQYLARQASHTA